ncbi:MAG TPA: hypothetical protein VL240_01035 [Candidatus Binatia bacterium]|nr:hypothetical protein [Candidatus Binatia bacterium]
MSLLKKLALCLVPVVFFSLFPVLLSAQDNMGMSNKQTMSVTGCLKQGSEAGGYYIMGEDGKMYELWGKGLSEHVNHKVTVTGTQSMMATGQESAREASEKQEAGSASYVDLRVHNVRMVSENCQ